MPSFALSTSSVFSTTNKRIWSIDVSQDPKCGVPGKHYAERTTTDRKTQQRKENYELVNVQSICIVLKANCKDLVI
jgi:hypothetical protein